MEISVENLYVDIGSILDSPYRRFRVCAMQASKYQH